MDPRFLESDEIRLELDIRGQDPNQPQAVDILTALLEEEVAGIRIVPSQLHSYFRTINSELADIHWKKASVVLKSGDIEEIVKCQSRLLHLYGRLMRLELKAQNHPHVTQLKNEIDACIVSCSELLSAKLNSSPQTSLDNLEAEATRQLQTLSKQLDTERPTNICSSEPESNRGAIPKTSQPMASAGPLATDSRRLETLDHQLTQQSPVHTPSLYQTATSSEAPLPTRSSSLQDVQRTPPASQMMTSRELQSLLGGHMALDPQKWPQNPLPCGAKPPPSSSLPSELQQCISNLLRLLQSSTAGPPAAPERPEEYLHVGPSTTNSGFPQPSVAGRGPDSRRQTSSPANNVNPGWAMGKWPTRFSGGLKDLPVDEFIFRTETLARLSGVPQSALTLGLHQLLSGAAASWYWIHIRNHPDSSWAQTRAAMTLAFQTNVSDTAIRRQIMDRLQRPNERFMDFQLAIQELEVRLACRMSEQELLETLRRNMLPHLQDRLLFLPIYSMFDLQARVHQVESLAQQQAEVQPLRKYIPRIHEIATNSESATETGVAKSYPLNFSVPPPNLRTPETRSNPFASQIAYSDPFCPPDEQSDFVCAMEAVDRNQFVVCWNCDEIGHTFMDCAARRIIFCYGCGAKNVVRPQCAKCSVKALQGNGRGSVRPDGGLLDSPRQGGQPLRQPNLYRRPQ